MNALPEHLAPASTPALPRAVNRRRHAGNTLMEYGTIGMVLVVGAIGVTLLLGNNLNLWFDNLKTDMRQSADTAAKQAVATQTAKRAVEATQALAAANRGGTVRVIDPSGATSATAPQTVGANGTDALAQNIADKALACLKSGQITQQEYNLIQQVSNAGHDIATLQGLLATAALKANGNTSIYDSPIYSYKGQTYTGSQLSSMLQATVNKFQSLQTQAEGKEDVIRAQDLLVALQESGGEILNNGWDSINNTQSAAKAVYIGTVQQAQGYDMGSAQTHKDSGNICSAGSLSDTGSHCNP